jgi:NAD(P)-dependent dehydrogenase (short-subunit alcohol dehydrogenase family)
MMVEHKVVIITGATGGLGRVAAKRFAHDGARLVLVGTNMEKLKQLAAELDLPNDQILMYAADLNQPEAAAALTQHVLDTFGRLDILLHLVGGWSGGKTLVDVDDQQVETMLQQHLWTTFHLAQACIPVMTANHWGRILVISSPTASHPTANSAPYAIGKAAQEALMMTIAQETKGSGITANILLVKTIDVEHVRDQNPDSKNAEWTTPEEITATLLHLSTEDAGVITGARIPLFGG